MPAACQLTLDNSFFASMIRSREVALLAGVTFAGTLALLWLWNRRKQGKAPSAASTVTEVRESASSVNSDESATTSQQDPEPKQKDVPTTGKMETQSSQDSESVSLLTASRLPQGVAALKSATSMDSLFVNPRRSPSPAFDDSDTEEAVVREGAETAELENLIESPLGVWIYAAPQDEDDHDRVQLVLPADMVGRFIGRSGRNIKTLQQTGASINLGAKPSAQAPQGGTMCTVAGRYGAITEVLKQIKDRFPGLALQPLRWPVDRENASRQTVSPPGCVSFSSSSDMEEVTLPFVDSPESLWLQLLRNGQLSDLERLHEAMQCVYGVPQASVDNALPKSALPGSYCAALLGDQWLRARLLRRDEVTSQVQFSDFGRVGDVPTDQLMVLR